MTKEQKLKLIKNSSYGSAYHIICMENGDFQLKFQMSAIGEKDTAYWIFDDFRLECRTIKEESVDIIQNGISKIEELNGEKNFWKKVKESLFFEDEILDRTIPEGTIFPEMEGDLENPEGLDPEMWGQKFDPKGWTKNADGSYTAK